MESKRLLLLRINRLSMRPLLMGAIIIAVSMMLLLLRVKITVSLMLLLLGRTITGSLELRGRTPPELLRGRPALLNGLQLELLMDHSLH